MRVLVLDDDRDRHDFFDRELREETLVHVLTYTEAVHVLERYDGFDMAFLDHDIGDDPELIEKGLPPKTGADVASFIAKQLPTEKRPKQVVVISWNHGGASCMLSTLRKAGVPAIHLPFSTRMRFSRI